MLDLGVTGLADSLDALDAAPPGLRIVLAHWAPSTTSNARWAAALRAAGADLIVGTHPHSAQPVQVGRRAPVLFSLDNGAYFLHSLLEPHAPWGAIPRGARWERP